MGKRRQNSLPWPLTHRKMVSVVRFVCVLTGYSCIFLRVLIGSSPFISHLGVTLWWSGVVLPILLFLTFKVHNRQHTFLLVKEQVPSYCTTICQPFVNNILNCMWTAYWVVNRTFLKWSLFTCVYKCVFTQVIEHIVEISIISFRPWVSLQIEDRLSI